MMSVNLSNMVLENTSTWQIVESIYVCIKRTCNYDINITVQAYHLTRAYSQIHSDTGSEFGFQIEVPVILAKCSINTCLLRTSLYNRHFCES